VFPHAASKYGKTTSQVRNIYYRHHESSSSQSPNKSRHGNSLLNSKENETLICVCIAFSASSIPLRPQILPQFVKTLFNKNTNRKRSSKWLQDHRNFFSTRKTKHLANKRTEENIRDHVIDFLDSIELAMERHNYNSHNVVNYDETRICA
jgi:hypothetical protein